MGIEIERKFLVDPTALGDLGTGIVIKQGYIPTQGKTVVRARIKGEQAFLTIKGAAGTNGTGIGCSEFEYEIPLADAEAMLAELCVGAMIDKTRYEIPVGQHLWEVDVFHGDNAGLIVAEIELQDENEPFEHPAWVTEQVTGQARYYNVNLLNHPYSEWS